MSVRRAEIYHLKWVEKNQARLFYDVLTQGCLFLIVPEMLKICLFYVFLRTLSCIRFILLLSPLTWNIDIRGQYPK